MWALSDGEQIIMINMLKILLENVDNMHEQVGNFSREVEIVRKSQWKC